MSFCHSNIKFTYEEETDSKIPVLADNQFIESVFGKAMFSDVYFKLDSYLATYYFKRLTGYSIHLNNRLQIDRTFTIQDAGASCFLVDHFYSPKIYTF